MYKIIFGNINVEICCKYNSQKGRDDGAAMLD